jgi:hypothetical protein
MRYRVHPGCSVGCDPGGDGAIVLAEDGKLIESYPFKGHVLIVGFNGNLQLIDPLWLHDVLTLARLHSDRFAIESPVVTTYGGKITVESIVKLQQTYSQIVATAAIVGFTEIVHANPQNWQGYHSIQKEGALSVKQVIDRYFKGQGLVYSSGVADALCISQYEYLEPPKRSVAKVKQSGKTKVVF